MKYSVLSLFSGCGGLDLGFKKAGFHTVFATDVWNIACDTLKENNAADEVVCEDIRNVDFTRFHNSVDVVIGGPPCPPYSQTRHYLTEKKGGFEDEKAGFAVPEYFRAIKEINPKVFMFENIIKAKDNELLLLNRKKEYPSNFFIETLITDPSVIVNKLNDELLLYKDIYNKQMKYIKQLKKSLEQSEIVNDNIEEVCHKYKQTIKSLLSTKSISSNELSDYQRTGLQLGISKSNKTLNYSSLSINSRRQTQLGLIQRLEDYEKKTSRKKNKISTESDWIEALRFCDMTQEEFYRYAKSKINEKLCSMIEYLYKLIVDKNNHLQLLIKENETLSIDNLRLNKNNLELIDELHLEIEEKNISYIANNEKESQEEETNYNSKDFNKFFEQIKESITSTEFNEGMAVDQFELESKMSN